MAEGVVEMHSFQRLLPCVFMCYERDGEDLEFYTMLIMISEQSVTFCCNAHPYVLKRGAPKL